VQPQEPRLKPQSGQAPVVSQKDLERRWVEGNEAIQLLHNSGNCEWAVATEHSWWSFVLIQMGIVKTIRCKLLEKESSALTRYGICSDRPAQ